MEQINYFEQIKNHIVERKIFHSIDFKIVEGADSSYFGIVLHRGTVDFNELLQLQVAGYQVINVREYEDTVNGFKVQKIKVNVRELSRTGFVF